MKHLPDEALFYVADLPMSVDDVLVRLYNSNRPALREHFTRVNAHLVEGRVQPGQVVVLTPETSSACLQWEEALSEAAARADDVFARLSEQERVAIARNYALLSDVANGSSYAFGVANDWMAQKLKRVEFVLKEIETLYVNSYNASQGIGGLSNTSFYGARRGLFAKLDLAINGVLRRSLFSETARATNLRGHLGLSSKSLVHQWNQQGRATSVPAMASHYERIARQAKYFKTLGYVGVGFTVAGGVAEVKRACALDPESESCRRARFVTTAETAGAVAGAAAGAGLATKAAGPACVFVVGTATGGPGIPVCLVAAGLAGGIAGAFGLSGASRRASENIYESHVRGAD